MPHDNRPEGFEREIGPGGLEQRHLSHDQVEVRAERRDDGEGTPCLVGYGTRFDTTYRLGNYYQWDEEIAAGAFSDAIADAADVRSMCNHSVDRLLGRTTTGTLRLSEDDTGLRYEVDINPDDPSAMATWAQVDRGDIDGSSIWFRVVREEWTEPNDDNGLEVPLRRILQVDPLYEVGPVVFPANAAADVATRSGALVDQLLRHAGLDDPRRRADVAAELLANPEEVARILSRGARDESSPTRPNDVQQHRQRHTAVRRGLAARYGLTLKE